MEIQTRTPVNRRTVARTAAWAVPVVTTAIGAPAFATSGSGCQQRVVTGAIGTGSVTGHHHHLTGIAQTITFPGGVTATITYAKAGSNTDPYDDDGDGTPQTGTVSDAQYGSGWSYVVLAHAQGMEQGDSLTMTITFLQPVTDFSLTVTQIGSKYHDYQDWVSASPAGFSATNGAKVTGAGTTTAPFASIFYEDIHSPDYDVTLTWPTKGSIFTIDLVVGDHWNDSSCGQWVGVGNFSYQDCS